MSREVTFTNLFTQDIHIYTCTFRESVLDVILKKFPQSSTNNISTFLKVGEISQQFKLNTQYQYLAIIYSFDEINYGVMNLCDYSGSNNLFNVNLIEGNSSNDISYMYGYPYIKVGTSKSVNNPILDSNITQYVDKNCGNNTVKFVDGLCVSKDIISKLGSIKKGGLESKDLESKDLESKDIENTVANFSAIWIAIIGIIIFLFIILVVLLNRS